MDEGIIGELIKQGQPFSMWEKFLRKRAVKLTENEIATEQ